MNELHPIQLRDIVVTQLSIKVPDPKAAQDYEGEIDLSIEMGISELIEGDGHVAVGIRTKVTPKATEEGAEPIFTVDVDLNGQFTVDLNLFKFEDLERWSQVNAPFLLLPYVREQVYGISVRAGIKGLIFPLFIQPRSLKSSAQP